jgi:monofunctional biosynthetic peptidoglycan transglycosylase
MQKHIKTMNAVAELKEAVQSRNKPKKCFPMARRSYIRKGLEAYFTVLIELVWGKERIMEVYLNSIEMGMEFMDSHLNTGIEKTLLILPLFKELLRFYPIQENLATSSSSYINRRKSKLWGNANSW